jgi:hypothetical protein
MNSRTATLAILSLAVARAASAAVVLNDTLNTYQIYGKDLVTIYGDSKTAQDGDIGSDKKVDFTNANNLVGGSVTSGGDITARENLNVAGTVNVRGDLTIENTNTFAKKLNVGGTLKISGGNPAGNEFKDSMFIRNSPIQVGAGWAANKYIGVNLTGNVNSGTGGKPNALKFGAAATQPFPSANLGLPYTIVDYDGSKNCTTPNGALFNMSMCGLGGSSSDTVLSPGRYGNFTIGDNNRIYLRNGTYQFKSLTLKSDGTRMIFLQGKAGVTQVLINGNFTVEAGKFLIAPSRYKDPTFNAGSVLFYANGNISLGDDTEIWATVVGPNATILVESGVHLFGQVFGKVVNIENGFDGTAGKGKYYPMNQASVFKYSVIHYKHKY